MSNENFYKQLNGIKAPHGLIYFIENYKRRYESLEHCRESMLSHLISINEYDSMQLHGYKTLDELVDIVESNVYDSYERDKNIEFSFNKVAVNVREKDLYEATKSEIESQSDFIRWVGNDAKI